MRSQRRTEKHIGQHRCSLPWQQRSLGDVEASNHDQESVPMIFGTSACMSGVALPDTGKCCCPPLQTGSTPPPAKVGMEKFDRAANTQLQTRSGEFLVLEHSQIGIPVGAAFTFRSAASPRACACTRALPSRRFRKAVPSWNFRWLPRCNALCLLVALCCMADVKSSKIRRGSQASRCSAVAEGKRSAAKRFASFIFSQATHGKAEAEK